MTAQQGVDMSGGELPPEAPDYANPPMENRWGHTKLFISSQRTFLLLLLSSVLWGPVLQVQRGVY